MSFFVLFLLRGRFFHYIFICNVLKGTKVSIIILSPFPSFLSFLFKERDLYSPGWP